MNRIAVVDILFVVVVVVVVAAAVVVVVVVVGCVDAALGCAVAMKTGRLGYAMIAFRVHTFQEIHRVHHHSLPISKDGGDCVRLKFERTCAAKHTNMLPGHAHEKAKE